MIPYYIFPKTIYSPPPPYISMVVLTKTIRPTTKYMIRFPLENSTAFKESEFIVTFYMDKKAKPSEVKAHAIARAISMSSAKRGEYIRHGAYIFERVGNDWKVFGDIVNISMDDFSADFFDPSNGTRTRINFLGHKI